jgi:uncharacterized protein (TIGR03437 family)
MEDVRVSMPKLHRLVLAAAALLAAVAPPLPAQQNFTSVALRVETNVIGATFWVDGQPYQTSALFTWPEGSQHTLEIRNEYLRENLSDGQVVDPNQYDPTFHTRFRFFNWEESTGQLEQTGSSVIRITASRQITYYRANFRKQHGVFFYINHETVPQFLGECNGRQENFSGSGLGPSPFGFLDTMVCGCLTTSAYAWIDEGATVALNAVAYPGYAFERWELPPGPNGPFTSSLIITRPTTIRAYFVEARRIYFETAPVRGLQLVIDRNYLPTKRHDQDCLPVGTPPLWPPWLGPTTNPGNPPPPFTPVVDPARLCRHIPLCNGELDWIPGTEHVLAAPPSQQDAMGNIWVFDRWDLGNGEPGGQNTVFTVPPDYRPHTLTAHFVRGARVSFVTSPVNLKLQVDGRENWPGYNFEWGVGHTHKFAAPLEQADAKGRRWRFVRWSNEGEAEQEVVIPADAADNGLRYIAEYELLGQLTLRSEPAQLALTVNGAECTTPCVIDRPAGTEISIAAQPERSFSEDTRIEFSGWGDTESPERTYSFTQEADTLTARYQHYHRLTLLSDPEEGAKYNLNPAAGPGSFFTAGVRVDVNVEGNPGFKFRRFDGALSGTLPTGSVTMNRPATIAARFDRVPALPEGAVQNAAGETPDPVVAPGSLIAIRGRHLASHFESGYTSPLKQTLLGVTVHVGDRLLPLLHVSSEEIIAQLPSSLPPGAHKLAVRQLDQPEVTADFEVATVAPGLFMQPEQELPYAEIYHADGKPVTVEHPAKPGETLMLTGTGFGRTNPHWLDGFFTPEHPPLPLIHPVELLIEGEPQPHLWVGAQPNRVGRNLLRFVLGTVAPGPDSEGRNLRVQVRIQGRTSNTVLLPIAIAQ